MRLIGPDNTYLTFRKEIDWEIEGMGPQDEKGRRPMPKFVIRSNGGGSKYARGKGHDIIDAIYRIVTDGESLSNVGDLDKLDQDHMIIGDKTDCEATTNLTVGRVDQLLTIGVSSTDDESGKKKSVQFYISPAGERYDLDTGGIVLIASCQRFQQLVDIALAIQNYCKP